MPGASAKASSSWTPGSLIGKALNVFSGAEHRKLRAICSFFPHDDNTDNPNVWEAYAESFGYLSPGAQSSNFAECTIAKLLLVQIRLEQTFYLTHALQSTSTLDQKHILSAIMTTCMNENEKLYDGRYRQSRDTILVTSTKEAQALVHVLQFIPRIATQSDLACRTVLEAGILDMLLRVYVLFPSFSRSSIDAPEHWPPLLQACRSTLLALSQSEINHDAVLEHSVCALWADCHPHPPPYSVEPPSIKDSIPARQAGWRRANRRCVKRRIMAVIIDSQWRSNVYEIEDIEVCTDIVEFTQSQFYDPEIVKHAFLAMLKLILLNRGSADHLVSAMGTCILENIVYIFSGIIRLWFECVQMQMQHESIYGPSSHQSAFRATSIESHLSPTSSIDLHENFYDHEKTRLFKRVLNVDAALYKIIIFATDAARASDIIRCGMLKAGVLSLVIVAFANADFIPSNLINTATNKGKQKEAQSVRIVGATGQDGGNGPTPVPLEAIQNDAATLSALIHSAKFKESWGDKRLNSRRRLCSSLVDVLLEDFGAKDQKHAWIQALFRKIVE